MNRLMIFYCVSLLMLASCKQNPENGGEEIRGEEQRSDTPMRISNYPNEGDSGSNSRFDDGNSRISKPGATGKRNTEGTREDSLKSKANPLYKGDNSDTNRKPE